MFEGAIGDFDLTVGPRMLEFGEPVFNVMLLSHHIKGGAFCFLALGVVQAVHR
ncbi:hypothetical protein [Holospora obtusa]|uniref:hypothetical protein n=1 Tax=Holospora obtusa TaxID=49893 RepID=UPI0003AE86A5|nr:hypothetical protein [Holospora obtusa]